MSITFIFFFVLLDLIYFDKLNKVAIGFGDGFDNSMVVSIPICSYFYYDDSDCGRDHTDSNS